MNAVFLVHVLPHLSWSSSTGSGHTYINRIKNMQDVCRGFSETPVKHRQRKGSIQARGIHCQAHDRRDEGVCGLWSKWLV